MTVFGDKKFAGCVVVSNSSTLRFIMLVKNMLIELNTDVVYVKGAKAGAIYDLTTGDVFSVNALSCSAIDKIISGDKLSKGELEYRAQLSSSGLLRQGRVFREYKPNCPFPRIKMCWLEVTHRCNCRCIHCYEGDYHCSSANPLTLAEWKRVIDQLVEHGIKQAVVIGGEPSLNNDTVEILAYLSSYHINTTVFSNGISISEELKQEIVENRMHFKCSLYGFNAKTHDFITKHPGSFEKLTNNILYFRDHSVDVTIAVVIMKENEQFYDEILKYVKSLGVRYRFDVIREVFGGSQSKHVPCNADIIRSVMRTSPIFAKVSKEKFDIAAFHNSCWFSKLAICEDGTVLPCVFERDTVLGNIRKQQLADILNSEKLHNCWNYSMDKVKMCCKCEFRFACRDCRPLASASGCQDAKNPRCTYNAYTGEWNGP